MNPLKWPLECCYFSKSADVLPNSFLSFYTEMDITLHHNGTPTPDATDYSLPSTQSRLRSGETLKKLSRCVARSARSICRCASRSSRAAGRLSSVCRFWCLRHTYSRYVNPTSPCGSEIPLSLMGRSWFQNDRYIISSSSYWWCKRLEYEYARVLLLVGGAKVPEMHGRTDLVLTGMPTDSPVTQRCTMYEVANNPITLPTPKTGSQSCGTKCQDRRSPWVRSKPILIFDTYWRGFFWEVNLVEIHCAFGLLANESIPLDMMSLRSKSLNYISPSSLSSPIVHLQRPPLIFLFSWDHSMMITTLIWGAPPAIVLYLLMKATHLFLLEH